MTARDVAWQTLRWSITDGNAEGVFAIDESTGAVTLTNVGADFERTEDYLLTILLVDDGTVPSAKSDTTTLAIEVNDVNDRPVLTDQAREVPESQAGSGSSVVNTTVGAPLGGTDEDRTPTQSLSYAIVDGNVDGVFWVDEEGRFESPRRRWTTRRDRCTR